MRNGLILIFAILLQCIACHQEPAKSMQTEKISKVDQKKTSLKLEFTSGIGAIFEDSKGHYWLGSHQEGLCVFDGKKFTYFTTEEGLSDHQIRSIQEDHNGVIWLGTAKGINSFEGGEIKSYAIGMQENSGNEWTKTKTDLWFDAGNREGILRYDGQKLNYLAFPSPQIINPQNVYFVTSLAEGKDEMLWIGTYSGIFGYDGRQFTIINDQTLGLKKETGELHIRSILEDSKGRLWIGNNGIGVLLKEKDTIINFSEKHNLIPPTSSRRGDRSPAGTLEHVFTIEEDGDGNIWFGDRDTGVWKYDGRVMKNYTKQAGLSNDFAPIIYKDTKDALWFGMADGKVFKFNGKTFDKQF